MKKIRKFIRRVLLVVILIGAALWYFGPYEPADLRVEFDASALDGGVDAYLAEQESRFADITEGVQKQVIWAGAADAKAPWSVLYLHGFSATSQEIRPVPDMVADGLGANLVLTRLTGHGRNGSALATATVEAWMQDVAEGLAIARKTGDRVLILSASTGGTLAAAAALDPALMQDVAGIVMISPNFGVKNPMAKLINWPAARYWLPLIAGDTLSFTPQNEDHGRYWTTTYPSVAAMPMGALIKAVDALDLSKTTVPALFIFSNKDTVVRPFLTRQVSEIWGGPSQTVNPKLVAQDDPDAHVIAGDILSPAQNVPTATAILTWARGL